MRAHRSTEVGLLCLGGALALSLGSFTFPYIWALAASTSPADSGSFALHTFWIPMSGLMVNVAIAALGLLGFVFVWQGRSELGPERAARARLVPPALVLAFAAYAASALTGIVLGSLADVGFLIRWHDLFILTGALFVGIALYGTLSHLPVSHTRPVAAAAFSVGGAGSALLFLTVPGLGWVEVPAVGIVGSGLALVSLVLWLGLCLWGSQRLRQRGPAVTATSAVRDA